ncbi:GNAT family N-acetyltransferase [Brevibacillus daliensis]|uniref:GNAT family N-acetyltransferase n=1 Tax=Brevibacillus daliensis TaxID=2892995 RepID=UPI001E403879|nr:GNAT family N-acetyltransferase [Brevibacillus daliensis]
MHKIENETSVEVFLIEPTAKLKEEYLQFYNEWVESGESIVPATVDRDPQDFDHLLKEWQAEKIAENLPEGWVPASTYWLVTKERSIVGAVNIRHGLTEKLSQSGGHIGYGVRPSARRKGYASKMLALALEKASELGLDQVLVVCDEINTASWKTILKNGGIEDSDYFEVNGNVVKRFWIEVGDNNE